MTKRVPVELPIVASATGATALVAAVAGKRVRVLGYVLSADAAVNVKFRGASADITGLLYLGAKGVVSVPVMESGWFETPVGEALNINLSGNVAVGGHLIYHQF